MPEAIVAEVHVDVVMHIDVMMHVEIMRRAEGALDRPGCGMFIHMTDASVVGTVDKSGLAALHERASGFGTGCGFAALRGLGTAALLLMLLGVQERRANQKHDEAGGSFAIKN